MDQFAYDIQLANNGNYATLMRELNLRRKDISKQDLTMDKYTHTYTHQNSIRFDGTYSNDILAIRTLYYSIS